MDLNEIRKHLKQEIQRMLIENTTLITEKWSICDKVDEYYDTVLEDIRLDIPNSQIEKIDNGLYFITNQITNYTILEQTFSINYYIYNCINQKYCDFIYQEGEKLNGYEEDEKILNITLYMVNNRWVDDYCEKNLSHEIEHIIQINYGFIKNANYKKLMSPAYDQANEVLRSENGYNEIEKALAWLIYYSNSHEQDAFMQEYARELRKNPSFLFSKKSSTHNILNHYTYYAKYFLDNMENKDVLNAIKLYKIYGYNLSNIKMMCTKQLNRFKRKMNNIEKNFSNDNKDLRNETYTTSI